MYLGTNGQGLFLLNPKRFRSFDADKNNIDINGHLVYMSPSGKLFSDGGCNNLIELDHQLNVLQSIGVNGCPWTVLMDHENNLWVNGALQSGKSSYKHQELADLLSNKLIYCMFEHEQIIYVGTNKGIFYCDRSSAGIIQNSKEINAVYCFYQNSSNQLLATTKNGIVLISPTKHSCTQYPLNMKKPSDVRSIYEDEEGNYWLGTSKKGLKVWMNNTLYSFPFSDGRLNKNVWAIIEDDYGYLWMSSNQGIYRAKRTDLLDFAIGKIVDFSSELYTEADGLKSSEGNSRTQNKAFKDEFGSIWFSMITGPAVITPSPKSTSSTYPIILDYVEVDGKKVNPNNPKVPPNFSQVAFGFAQYKTFNNRNISYQYQIGDGNPWHTLGSEKYVSFTELKAGEYDLHIKRADSSQLLTIPFEIEAHFYQTNAFNYLIAAFATAVIFLIGFRIWRIRRKQIAKKKKQDAELKSLELVALQSQMNPHFIFNCLSSISSLYVSGNQQSANDYMSRFSSLLRIILEHAQKRLITLKEDLEMFEIYVPLERLQFDESFDFELKVDDQLRTDEILIPSMVTHTFIENAIKHGLKPLKNRKGKLKITVDKFEDFTRVCVEDNGIGYENSIQAKKSKILLHKSHGLKNTGKRIELINLLNDLNIKVETINLKSDSGKSIGTKVTILFPYILQNKDEDTRN